MFSLKRALELNFLGLVYLSSALLGFSQGNWQLAAISAAGGTLAWLLVDWLGWIQMPRWLANLLSIGVLVLTMRDFFRQDSSLQLVAVANLLVYLQTILLFQEKNPRQYWQLAVLNLLQVVVATIFTLQFEGGFMFLSYMTLAGVMLLLINLETEAAPSPSQTPAGVMDSGRSSKTASAPIGVPQLRFNPPERIMQQMPGMLGYLLGWALISIAFSCVLFVLVPRNESAWFGPKYMNASATGISKKMELDPRGLLKFDTAQIFRAQFLDPESKEPQNFAQPVYMRGLSLGHWSIENEITTWSAPYDRLDRFGYELLPKVDKRRSWLEVEYTIEPTDDPMLYCCLPAFIPRGEPDQTDFCLELSALSRKRDVQRIEQSPFKYKLWVPRTANGELAQSWPYISGATAKSAQTLAGNPNDRNWLLMMDPARYPRIVSIASEISGRVGKERPLELARALEQHFIQSREYLYTTDFTRVPRRAGIDPIEDFVANHKMGHCEMYASALTLMLRSQGIPSRVVVGYCGGNFNTWANFYTFSNEHAHAWVEAYIPPEHCTEEMIRDEAAGPGGAWLTLDPTPPSNLRRNANLNGTQALDLARTMWQEYVLGLDASTQESWNSSGGILSMLRLDSLSNSLQLGFARVQQSPALRLLVVGLILLVLVASVLLSLFRRPKKKRLGPRPPGLLRRLMSKALGMISPRFGQWLLEGAQNGPVVPFYQRLTELLAKQGLRRQLGETHREFLNRAAGECQVALANASAGPGSNGATANTSETSAPVADLWPMFERAFHSVRFGGNTLPAGDLQSLEQGLETVEAKLSQLPRESFAPKS
jgi:transglutaminase-like putative cysteine protease